MRILELTRTPMDGQKCYATQSCLACQPDLTVLTKSSDKDKGGDKLRNKGHLDLAASWNTARSFQSHPLKEVNCGQCSPTKLC